MTRSFARELAFQALFSSEVGHHDPAESLASVTERADLSRERAFVRDLVLGTHERQAELDAEISPLLRGWTIDRLPTADLVLLRMGLFELRHVPQTPRAVVIDEIVELAKKFSTEDSGRYVNGVLAAASLSP